MGMYSLGERYYDPETGRFISPDVYVSTGQGLLGNNMFAYCNNNPVMYVDHDGEFPVLHLIVDTVVSIAVLKNLGAIVSSNIVVYVYRDVEPMEEGEFNKIQDKESTKGLSLRDKVAYIKRFRDVGRVGNNDELRSKIELIKQNWTEAEMLREMVYHEKFYYLFKIVDMQIPFVDLSGLIDKAKDVEFEGEQNWITYIRRIIGNIFW